MSKFTIVISFFSIFFFSLSNNEIVAQNCSPDATITSPGFYPEELDIVKVGEDYEQTIQVLAIKDTLVVFAGQSVTAIIDSMVLVDVFGLPEGFEYACNSPRCLFKHPDVGCVKLYGNANASQVGVYPLTFKVTTYGRVGILRVPQTDTLQAYNLIISLDGKVAIEKAGLTTPTVYPNPNISGILIIESDEVVNEVFVSNVLGEKIDFQHPTSNRNTIDITSLSAGVYWIAIATVTGVYHHKVIKK